MCSYRAGPRRFWIYLCWSHCWWCFSWGRSINLYIFAAIKQDPDGSGDTNVSGVLVGGVLVGVALLMFIYLQL